MRTWSNIKSQHEEHVKRLLKQFPQLQYEIDDRSYNGLTGLYICGDVEIVNEYFRLYYMYVNYCDRLQKYFASQKINSRFAI